VVAQDPRLSRRKLLREKKSALNETGNRFAARTKKIPRLSICGKRAGKTGNVEPVASYAVREVERERGRREVIT
jgi:hypothetical protein